MKKWLKIIIPSVALMLAASFSVANSKPVCLFAEGEEESSEPLVVSEEPETSEELEPEVSEDEGFFKRAYKEYIAPLFAGVSLVSIGTAIITFTLNQMDRKKRNKVYDERDRRLDERERQLDEKILKLEQKDKEHEEIIANCLSILATVVSIKEINDETIGVIKENMAKFDESLQKLIANTQPTENLKKAVVLVGQIQIKVAKQSQNVVKSGIVEDINELSKLLKTM